MSAGAFPAEIVAGFTMTVAAAEPSPEARERWTQRAQLLATWLMEAWQRERRGEQDHAAVQDEAHFDEGNR